MSYRGCPTCADVDQWGRAPIGECGPDCLRRKARLDRIATARAELEGFAAAWARDADFRRRWSNSHARRAMLAAQR